MFANQAYPEQNKTDEPCI